jgi:hypothetical protein
MTALFELVPLLETSHRLNALRGWLRGIRPMLRVDVQRSAVGRQLPHVEQHEAVRREDILDNEEREIRDVFVVDGVELVALHQSPHRTVMSAQIGNL